MSDNEDDFTSINELPEDDSEEVAMARRVKHKIVHDTDDEEDEDEVFDSSEVKAATPSLFARFKGRLFEASIVFVLIIILTWPSIQDIIDRMLGNTSTVAPVLAKAALGAVTFFLARDFIESKKKLL